MTAVADLRAPLRGRDVAEAHRAHDDRGEVQEADEDLVLPRGHRGGNVYAPRAVQAVEGGLVEVEEHGVDPSEDDDGGQPALRQEGERHRSCSAREAQRERE